MRKQKSIKIMTYMSWKGKLGIKNRPWNELVEWIEQINEKE